MASHSSPSITSPRMYYPGASSPAQRRLWMVTFVDLTTLLLAFFVLMFSMSNVEPNRYRVLTNSYSSAFGLPVMDRSAAKMELPTVTAVLGENLSYLAAVLSATFAESPSLKDVEFNLTSQYLKLSLPHQDLFAPGSGVFRTDADSAIFDLGGVLSNLNNRIAVVGSAAMNQTGARDVDKWTLAIKRAHTLAAALETAGYDQQITVFGQGGLPTDVSAALGRVDIFIMPYRPMP